jgi:hypothetical protein
MTKIFIGGEKFNVMVAVPKPHTSFIPVPSSSSCAPASHDYDTIDNGRITTTASVGLGMSNGKEHRRGPRGSCTGHSHCLL